MLFKRRPGSKKGRYQIVIGALALGILLPAFVLFPSIFVSLFGSRQAPPAATATGSDPLGASGRSSLADDRTHRTPSIATASAGLDDTHSSSESGEHETRSSSADNEIADDAWAGPCGRRGLEAADGSCICTAMWAGPTCEEGNEYAFAEDAPALRIPSGFLKNIGMAADGLVGANREIKIHLPGKTPPWRYIAKAKGELLQLVPPLDPVTAHRYDRCALVGNAGVLLNNPLTGREIDAHDMVFRFNGAPTKGMEDFVGSRTHFRLVNSKWADYREADESVLWNMRAPGSLDFYKERKSKNRSEKFFIFSADFVNYIGQTAEQLSKSFTGADAEAFSSLEGGYTPTSGITGVLIALNLCRAVTIYGMQVSEAQGYPYHYHNRCPQPHGARDIAEWLIFDRLVKERLVTFNEPCVVECHGSEAECAACRQQHPETYTDAVKAAAMRIWSKNPMPDYCASRAELLKRERDQLARGGEAFTKDERDKIMKELADKNKERDIKAERNKTSRGTTRGFYKLLR